jgi:predicted Zn-dependent protease
MAVIAILAHELGHVILLEGGHLSRDTEDTEPTTDLLTVYLGMGYLYGKCRPPFFPVSGRSQAGLVNDQARLLA